MKRLSKFRIVYSLIVIFLCLIVANCNRIIEQRKQHYYDSGMKLFNKGDYAKAIQEFGKALQIDGGYIDAHYMTGMSKYTLGEYAAALESFLIVFSERKEDIPLKLKIAECYIITQLRQRRQQDYFARVISPLAEKNRDARILLLRYYVGQNKFIEAEKMIEEYLRNGEKSADFYLALVQLNLKRNRVPEAADIALQHFSATPAWIKAMQQVIDKLRSAKNYNTLEKIYLKIIEQAADKLPYQTVLVELYDLRREEEKEEKLLRVMLKDYPDNLQVKTGYLNFLMRSNRMGEAESILKEEINKQPENMQLKKMLIDLFVQSGQMKKAYQQTEEMLRALPKDTNNYIEFQNILAELYFKSGEFGKAKINAEEILSKYKRDRDARFLLCKLYIQEKKALPAIGELRLLVGENPTIAEYNYYLGLAHEMRGETDLAKKAFGAALESSPGYKDALKKWIALCPKGDSLGEAEKKIKNYLNLHPDDNEIKILQQSNQEQTGGVISSPNVPEKQNPR